MIKNSYRFEVVFLRIIFQKEITTETTLAFTLQEDFLHNQEKSITYSLDEGEKQQLIKIKKYSKIVQLKQISFKFHCKEEPEKRVTINYHFKVNALEKHQKIPIDVDQLIDIFEKQKKTISEHTHNGGYEEIIYKIYVQKNEVNQSQQSYYMLVTPPPDKNKDEIERKNSLRNSRRPATLIVDTSIAIRNSIVSNKEPEQVIKSERRVVSAMKAEQAESYKKPPSSAFTFIQPVVPYPEKDSAQTLANINIGDLKQQYERKKDQDLIKIGVATDELKQSQQHRKNTSSSQHESHGTALSYKMKIVISLLLFGVFFLIYDVLGDKEIKNKNKRSGSHRKKQTSHQKRSKSQKKSKH